MFPFAIRIYRTLYGPKFARGDDTRKPGRLKRRYKADAHWSPPKRRAAKLDRGNLPLLGPKISVAVVRSRAKLHFFISTPLTHIKIASALLPGDG